MTTPLREAARRGAVVYDPPVVDEPLDSDRRFVLRALVCLAPAVACARTDTATTRPLELPPAPVPAAVATLGTRYLAEHPEDADREHLRRALGLDAPGSEATRLARIDDALRRDLETGDVVDLEGWQLTRTECRLYALAALS